MPAVVRRPTERHLPELVISGAVPVLASSSPCTTGAHVRPLRPGNQSSTGAVPVSRKRLVGHPAPVLGRRVRRPCGSSRDAPVIDENSRPVESASLEVLQRLLCL
jgi:hypothetical protein